MTSLEFIWRFSFGKHWDTHEPFKESLRVATKLGEKVYFDALSQLRSLPRGNGIPLQKSLRLFGGPFAPYARVCQSDAALISLILTTLPHGSDTQVASKLIHWATRWKQFSCPVVALKPEQFTALTLTDSDCSVLPESLFSSPWPAFLIRIPGASFPVVVNEEANRVSHVMVQAFQGEPYKPMESTGTPICTGVFEINSVIESSGTFLHSGVRNLNELYSNIDLGCHPMSTMQRVDDLEARAISVASRMTLSLLVAFNSQGIERRKPPKGKRLMAAVRGSDAEFLVGPTVSIGKEVADELRGELHHYLNGSTSFVRKARWVVRGHWRNQAHGTSMALRSLRWISPHWSGHSSLPPLVKDYQVKA